MLNDLKTLVNIQGNQYFFEAKMISAQAVLDNFSLLAAYDKLNGEEIKKLNAVLYDIENAIDSAAENIILNSYYYFKNTMNLESGFDEISQNFSKKYTGLNFYPFTRENIIKKECSKTYASFLKNNKMNFYEWLQFYDKLKFHPRGPEGIRIGKKIFIFGSGAIYAKCKYYLSEDFNILMELKHLTLVRIKLAQIYIAVCEFYLTNKRLPSSLSEIKYDFDKYNLGFKCEYNQAGIKAVFHNDIFQKIDFKMNQK